MIQALRIAAVCAALVSGGCTGATGVVLEVMLSADCTGGAFPAVSSLHVEVVPCFEDPGASDGYVCSVTSAAELVPIADETVTLDLAGAATGDSFSVAIRDLTDTVESGVERVRIALSLLDGRSVVVGFGRVDVQLRLGELVRRVEPVVVNATCGAPAGLDYDGDGAVGDDDCAPYDPARGATVPEKCGNDIDEDCDGIPLECTPPLVNPADQDEDGFCAFGLEDNFAGDPAVLSLCAATGGFTDCDDTDAAIVNCPCTDVDGDGWCAEPAPCAHAPGVTCNAAGGDCCDKSGDPGCGGPWAAEAINPGASEVCSNVDLDCSGDAWDLSASPCYSSDPLSGACSVGVLCADAGGGSWGCHLPEVPDLASEAGLCSAAPSGGTFECAGCDNVLTWDTGVDGVCGDTALAGSVQVSVLPPGLPDSMCSWSVVTPSWPLVITPAAGSSCSVGQFQIDPSAVPGPGYYVVYLRYERSVGPADFVAVVLDIAEGDCVSANVGAACGAGYANPICAGW